MRQTKIRLMAAGLLVGAVLGGLVVASIRPARADQGDDLHRIAIATEQISRHLERCK